MSCRRCGHNLNAHRIMDDSCRVPRCGCPKWSNDRKLNPRDWPGYGR